MNTNKFTVVAILATLILASTAIAQRGDGGGQQRGGQRGGFTGGQRGFGGGQRGGMFVQSEAQLIARPDVQKDIKLTEEQKTKLEALLAEQAEAMRARFEGMRGGARGGGDAGARGGRGNFDMEAFRAEMEKAQKEANTKIKAIVTDVQWKRLGEIKIQMMGTRAVLNEEIQKTLGIKATQIRDITTLNESLSTANRAIYARMRDQNIDQDALRKELENNNKIFDQELAKILTAEQRRKLATMKGKDFKPDPNYRPPGRGGRGGGGGGGG